MVTMNTVKLSKKMSFLLRHNPASAGLVLNAAGWVPVAALAQVLQVPVAEVAAVVEQDSKQRFMLQAGMIRAVQGHSFELSEELFIPTVCPEMLFHGTTPAAWVTIQREGLRPMSRAWVHLSQSPATAASVGGRRTGTPVVLQVNVAELTSPVFETVNRVWLTKEVPAFCLTVVQ